MRAAWTAILLLTAAPACSYDRRFGGAPPEGPLAVSATAIGGAGSETCRHGERGSWCDSNKVQLISVTAAPTGIFAIGELPQESPPAPFSVRALAEGEATFTIVANDGFETRTFEGRLAALAINRVTYGPVRGPGGDCAEPYQFGTGMSIEVPFELYHDATALKGSGAYPFVASGVTVGPSQIYDRKLILKAPAVAGSGELTSPADPAFRRTFDIFAASEVRAIRLGEPEPPVSKAAANKGSSLPLELDYGARVPCGESFSRTFSTSTPEQCLLSGCGWSGAGGDSMLTGPMTCVRIVGRQVGTCTVTVSLDGTPLTATKSFPVGP